MNEKRKLKANEVLNGTWGEVWVNGSYMANVIAFKAEATAKTTTVSMVQNLTDGQKLTGIERKGEVKFHKVNSSITKMLINELKKGKMPTITIISNLNDPDVSGNERVACYGCKFEKAIIADWEAGKMLEESYSFTYEDEAFLDTIS